MIGTTDDPEQPCTAAGVVVVDGATTVGIFFDAPAFCQYSGPEPAKELMPKNVEKTTTDSPRESFLREIFMVIEIAEFAASTIYTPQPRNSLSVPSRVFCDQERIFCTCWLC